MKLGLTGASGFVGSHLIKQVGTLYECESFSRSKHDIDNVGSMRHFVEDKDVIVHLAGVNRTNSEEMLKINAFGTFNLLEAIRKYSDAKIIFASSMQVYGLSQSLKYFKEDDALNPDNIYGASKQIAEQLIINFNKWYGIKGIILRFSNIYGPGCRPNYNSVIATFIDKAKKNEKIIVNGNGNQCRDLIFVSDVTDAFETAIKFNNSDIFNICTGCPTSINDVITLLNRINSPLNLEYRENDEEMNYLIGDPSRATKKLDFKTKIDMTEGLFRTFYSQGDNNGRLS